MGMVARGDFLKIKAQKPLINGILFDSKAEGDRYLELLAMERSGRISDLQCHPRYALLINGAPLLIRSKGYPNGRKVHYTADFEYIEDGEVVTEDVKGGYANKTSAGQLSRLRIAIFEATYGRRVRITSV